MIIFVFISLVSISLADELNPWSHGIEGMEDGRPLILAHRGASGIRPGHSIESYKLAIDTGKIYFKSYHQLIFQTFTGADIIECDVAVTKDGELVCIHAAYLSTYTDVSTRPEFYKKKRELDYEGIVYDDWWCIDFTLQELKEYQVPYHFIGTKDDSRKLIGLPFERANETQIKTIRLKQDNEQRNSAFDGQFSIPTFQEYLDGELLNIY